MMLAHAGKYRDQCRSVKGKLRTRSAMYPGYLAGEGVHTLHVHTNTQHTRHDNRQQQSARYDEILKGTARDCKRLQEAAIEDEKLRETTRDHMRLHEITRHDKRLQSTTRVCKRRHETATSYNILQDTAREQSGLDWDQRLETRRGTPPTCA